ncbi:hypothetical protein LTR96_009909 [Exophiala xenobiotica]|nr:hypothetical protein H2202_007498 [Exophiala xenobiotica]KAK5544750.1 hypothetical protein LTR23_004190 [Chaetothyriales sp. CCFEE 6169]KAK5191404.1 hypothetical protein LTR92_008575 [Exophiala xenobiotica]KAK5207087.1 hypothetical protein LTR41_007154 [Exophiala xenobiotica]KAK5218226.1 hypothetical protein LTR72_008827 [Exophiala xenobiotica]
MSDRGRRVRRPVSDFIEDISEDIFEESDTGSGEEDYDPRKADSMRRAGRNDKHRWDDAEEKRRGHAPRNPDSLLSPSSDENTANDHDWKL